MTTTPNDMLFEAMVQNPLLISKLGDCPNIEVPAAGGSVLWEDVAIQNGWKLQKNLLPNGHYRILDSKGIRKAWGSGEAMKEKFKRLTREEFLEPGDIIGVTRTRALGLYDHYAVYAGHNWVIHFAAEKGDFNGNISIHAAPMSEFLKDDKEYFVLLFGKKKETPIKIYHATNSIFSEGLVINTISLASDKDYKLYSPEETISRAWKETLADDEHRKKYNPVTSNCEHFAIWCKTGVSESHQVNRTLASLLGIVSPLTSSQSYQI